MLSSCVKPDSRTRTTLGRCRFSIWLLPNPILALEICIFDETRFSLLYFANPLLQIIFFCIFGKISSSDISRALFWRCSYWIATYNTLTNRCVLKVCILLKQLFFFYFYQPRYRVRRQSFLLFRSSFQVSNLATALQVGLHKCGIQNLFWVGGLSWFLLSNMATASRLAYEYAIDLFWGNDIS